MLNVTTYSVPKSIIHGYSHDLRERFHCSMQGKEAETSKSKKPLPY